MRLILVRHGETEENKEQIIQGQNPGHLSDLGKEQVKKLALRLKDEKIDYIYSSDLGRAVNTTKEILKFHKKVPVKYVPDLRERHMGIFEGRKRADLAEAKARGEFAKPEGGETYQQVYERAKKFLHQVLHQHLHQTVLFVGHGDCNRMFICALKKWPAEDFKKIEHAKNTGVTILEIDENKNHRLILFNCTKHLE